MKMKQNYQRCCPNDYIGRKNSSPYCKQLNLNFKSMSNYQRDIEGYYGEETNVSKIKEKMSGPINSVKQTVVSKPTIPYKPTVVSNPIIPSKPIEQNATKPWYQFWGGKKRTSRRKNRTCKKKYTL